MDSDSPCPFLDLPLELRLLIYTFAIHEKPTVTVGVAQLTGSYPDIIHRQYADGRSPYRGIPEGHEPVVRLGYDSSLLSLTKPTTIPTGTELPQQELWPAHLALKLLNKQIHDETKSHFKIQKNRLTDLFIQYPHGLHVCSTKAPYLVEQAKSLHLAGRYVPRTYVPARAACREPRTPLPGTDTKYNGGFKPDEAAQLGDLIDSLFGKEPKHGVQKLEMRIYYPGDDSYSTVWGDDSSPIAIALRNTGYADISIEVWRGKYGCGKLSQHTLLIQSLDGADWNQACPRSHECDVVSPFGLVVSSNFVEMLDSDRLSHRQQSSQHSYLVWETYFNMLTQTSGIYLSITPTTEKKRTVSTVWRKLEEGGHRQPTNGSFVVDPNWPALVMEYEMSPGPKGDLMTSYPANRT
jgi:hypothetical protein